MTLAFWTSVMETRSFGKPVAIRRGSRQWYCTAGLVAAVPRHIGGSLIRPFFGSCCSISEVQAGAPRMRVPLAPVLSTTRRTSSCMTWRLFGLIWALTGGLSSAIAGDQRSPSSMANGILKRVSDIVLLAVTTTDREEIHWLYQGAGRLFPEAWSGFTQGRGSAAEMTTSLAPTATCSIAPIPVFASKLPPSGVGGRTQWSQVRAKSPI